MKEAMIDGGVCLNCGKKTKKHHLICSNCIEEMGAVVAHKFTIDKQTKEIKKLHKQLQRKTAECEKYKQALDDIKQKAIKVRDEYMKEKSKEGKYFDAMIYGLGGLTEILDIVYNVKEESGEQ